MATTLAIIDKGDASPNDVELVDDEGAEGRTPYIGLALWDT
jgi:hypothetical protein